MRAHKKALGLSPRAFGLRPYGASGVNTVGRVAIVFCGFFGRWGLGGSVVGDSVFVKSDFLVPFHDFFQFAVHRDAPSGCLTVYIAIIPDNSALRQPLWQKNFLIGFT